MDREEIKSEIGKLQTKIAELSKALAELEGKKPSIKKVETAKPALLPQYHEVEGIISSINNESNPVKGEVKVWNGNEYLTADFTMSAAEYINDKHKFEVNKKVTCIFPKDTTYYRPISIRPITNSLKLVY